MDDFTAILEFLATVVAKLVDLTINIACGAFLVGSAFAPWRWPEIFHDLGKFSSGNKRWKEMCFESFICTLLDLVKIPLVCTGFLSPYRWFATAIILFNTFFSSCVRGVDRYDRFENRFTGFIVPFIVFADLICLPLIAFSLINPFGRQIILLKAMIWQDTPLSDFSDDFKLLRVDLNKLVLKYSLQSIMDIGVFMLSLLCVFAPSTWYGFFLGISEKIANSPNGRKKYCREWNEWFEIMREHFFAQFLHACIDIGVAPFLVVAALAPYRNRQLMHAIAQSRAKYATADPPSAPLEISSPTSNTPSTTTVPGPADVEIVPIPDEEGNITFVTIPNAQPQPQPEPTTPALSTYNRNNYEVGDFDYQYDYELRQNIFYIGLLALCDLLLLPMLLPLYITQYRYNAIKNDIFNQEGIFGHRELFAVGSQFCLLFIDMIYLSWSLPLLYLTLLRWGPVEIELKHPDVFRKRNKRLYLQVLKQLGFLILDCLFFPALVIVLLSTYRREEIARAINHPATMEKGCRIHYLIAVNFLMIIHDMALFIPAMIAMVLFAPYRVPLVLHNMFNHPFIDYDKPTGGSSKSDYRIIREHDNRLEHDMHNRLLCWEQFVSGIIDIPFLTMGIVVGLTAWRTQQLYSRLIAIDVPVSLNSDLLTDASQYLLLIENVPKEIRRISLEEFTKLLIDTVCLFPFGVILGTMYRVPELLKSFSNALRAGALKDEPLFTVNTVAVDYPPGNGEPTIKFLIKGDHTLEKACFDNLELHVLGQQLWEETGRIFGGLLAGVAKSYLPLPLEISETIDWDIAAVEVVEAPMDPAESTKPEIDHKPLDSDVEAQKVIFESMEEASPSMIPSAPPIPLQSTESASLWLKLPLKGVKKTTVIKKLNKFDSQTPMIWQLEGNISNSESAVKMKKVMFRCVLPVQKIVEALQANQEIPMNIQQLPSPSITSLMGESPSFVDEFHLLVLKVFVQVILDMIHGFLFFATMISPLRFKKLVRCMLEPKGKTDTRLIEKILFSLEQAEMHLRSYRASLVPTLNTKCKEEYVLHDHRYQSYYMNQRIGSRLQKVLHDYDFSRYKSLCAAAKRDLLLLDIPSDEFAVTVESIFELHDKVMTNWFLKYGVWMHFPFESHEAAQRRTLELAALVFSDQHDIEAKRLVSTKMKLLNIYSEENHKVLSKKSKLPGFLKRSSDQNRSLIRAYFRGMLTDLVGVLMIILLTVSLVRLVPTIRDIVQNSYSATPINMRSLLTKQCKILRHQMVFLGLSMAYILGLTVTVVGLPPFLAEVHKHIHSLEDIAECAEKHFKKFFKNLCRLLSLITVFRTYRMILKSTLYCALLPGAFIGDTIKSFTAECKFVMGSLIYLGILIACITTSAQLNSGEGGDQSADGANDAILGISATICIVLIALGMFKLSANLKVPQKSDLKRLNFSWSHIIGAAIGPMDCLQLSAVIMYFFWFAPTVKQGSPVSTVIESDHIRLGSDHLSGIIFWNSEDSDHSSSYRSAMSIAVVFIFFWALLIALPIAQGGAENSLHKNIKMLKVRNAPAYDALFMILSNSFSVWILATLMRSWSCVVNENGQAVLSSSETVTCGGGRGFWAGAISFPFLSYYAVTSALVYSDSSTHVEINSSKGPIENAGYVRFSASYATFMKVCQCFIVASCVGAFTTAPAIAVLLPIMIVCVVAAFLPWILNYYTKERICNVPGILPIRSASYIAVCWTSIICIIRSFADSPESMKNTVIFASEGVIYVGWAIIYMVGFAFTYRIEKKIYDEWQQVLKDQGLNDALDELTTTFESALIETDNQRNFLAQNQVLLTQYKERVAGCRSVEDIALLVMNLEDMIMIDKLSDSFLGQRNAWRKTLSEAHVVKNPETNKVVELQILDHESQQMTTPPSIQTRRFQVVLEQVAVLRLGFRSQLATTDLSREVLSILLSNKLPRDVIWYIFGYLVRTNNLRSVLTTDVDFYGRTPPALKNYKGGSYSMAMLDYSRCVMYDKSKKLQAEVAKLK
jgi:hypothetical protein